MANTSTIPVMVITTSEPRFMVFLLIIIYSAQLHGLPEYLSQELKVDVTVSPDPVNCVALGTAMSLGLNDKLETGFLDATPRMGRR